MALVLAATARNGMVNGAVDLLDAGGAAGHIELRSGVQPANPETAATGVVLATIALAFPAYGAAANGSAALAGTPRSGTGTAAAGTGTAATWFRAYDSAGAAVFDGSVGATGSGASLTLDNTSIADGQTVNITSLSFTEPAS